MKKNYETPQAEKIEFNYAETIVASGENENENFSVCEKINDNGNGNGCGKHPVYNDVVI